MLKNKCFGAFKIFHIQMVHRVSSVLFQQFSDHFLCILHLRILRKVRTLSKTNIFQPNFYYTTYFHIALTHKKYNTIFFAFPVLNIPSVDLIFFSHFLQFSYSYYV